MPGNRKQIRLRRRRVRRELLLFGGCSSPDRTRILPEFSKVTLALLRRPSLNGVWKSPISWSQKNTRYELGSIEVVVEVREGDKEGDKEGDSPRVPSIFPSDHHQLPAHRAPVTWVGADEWILSWLCRCHESEFLTSPRLE